MPKKSDKVFLFDSCIFISSYTLEPDSELCGRIINYAKYNKVGLISPICIGEVSEQLIEKLSKKDIDNRYESIMKDFKDDTLDFKKVQICFETLKHSRSFSSLRLSPHDTIHIACALANKCLGIITKDKDIIEEREKIKELSKNNGWKIDVFSPDDMKKSKYVKA